MSSIELAQLTPLQRDELAAWMLQNADSLPPSVRVALQQHSALCEGLLGSRRKLSQVLLQLRRALGIHPSSERRSSGDPLGPMTQGERTRRPKSKRQRLELNIEHHERLMSWHKQLRNKHNRELKATRSKLMQMPPDTEQDEDDRSETERAAEQAEVREHMARLQLGGEPQPALQSPVEAFMTGAQVATVEQNVPWPAPVVSEHEGKVIDTIIEERERFDFTFTVRRLALQVEKKVIETRDGERRVVSQSTAALGPPRYAVTWELLAHMSILVVQYAMPMNRLATMLSTDTKRFSAGTLARLLRYVSQRFAPIYMTLFDSLADAPILSGDDTSCRVLEVNRHFARTDAETPPWHEYRNTEAAQARLLAQGDNSLAAALASELGFEHARRNGDGKKKALHTTTISGRSDADDPHSLVVFYRSHLGGFGDLLQMLLRKRKPKRSKVTVQSDLSTANLVADERLLRLFTLHYAGCTSHARRPFALYEHEDPQYCEAILHLFKGLFIHERGLDLVGRNIDNVRAVRDVDSRQLWEQILEYAHDMTEHWSRETKLGEGARYIIRNYDKLTAYLDDPRLSPTSRVGDRRGGRLDHASPDCFSPFGRVSRSSRSSSPSPVPATSNRTGGFPAYGSPRGRPRIGVMCPFGLARLSARSVPHAVVIVETPLAIDDLSTPPLPAVAPLVPLLCRESPHLELDAGSHRIQLSCRVPNAEVVRPSANDRIDVLNRFAHRQVPAAA